MSKYFYSDSKVAKRKHNGYQQLATNPKTHMRALKEAERLKKELAELKEANRWRSVEDEEIPKNDQFGIFQLVDDWDDKVIELGTYQRDPNGVHATSGFYTDVLKWMPLPELPAVEGGES